MRSLEQTVLEPGSVNVINVAIDSMGAQVSAVNLGDEPKAIAINEHFGESIFAIEAVEAKEPRSKVITEKEICTDENVTAEEKSQLVDLLNKYKQCIASDVSEIGLTDKVIMDIELKDNTIVEAKPYRLNARDRNDLDDIITKYKL